MKKRFEYTRSNSVIFEQVILYGTVFLLITSLSNFLFSVFLPGSMYPTFIGVAALIVTAILLLPKIKTDSEVRGVEIDSDKSFVSIDGKKVENPEEINVLKFGTDKDARFQIKFSKNDAIDSREYNDSKRLLTLVPRTFPNVKTETHIIQSAVNTLVAIGLVISLVFFILSVVI